MIWNKYKNIIFIVIGFLLVIFIIRACEKEPKIVIKTETKTEYIRDTFIKTIISEPKTVYVQRIKTIEGETKVVYLDKPIDSSTIKGLEYETVLKSNNATANIKIVSTGELLDVQGTIDFPKETITTTITKSSAKSGLFVFGQVPINQNQINIEVGALYQFKNTFGIMGSVQYNEFTKGVDLKAGLLIKIF
jgi:hypothetical protein